MLEKTEIKSMLETSDNSSQLTRKLIGYFPVVWINNGSIPEHVMNVSKIFNLVASDIICIIYDHPEYDQNGIFFMTEGIYINTKMNVVNEAYIKYDEIESIAVSDKYNMCTVNTRDAQYLLTSDLWNNCEIGNILSNIIK